jgi:hypothetical protein
MIKTAKLCSEVMRPPGRYLNLGLAEFEAEVLTIALNYSFIQELVKDLYDMVI